MNGSYWAALEAQHDMGERWHGGGIKAARWLKEFTVGTPLTAKDIHFFIGAPLVYGETYFVAGDICDLLSMTGADYPVDGHIFEDLIPAHEGFALFDRPLPIPTSDISGLAAFTWILTAEIKSDPSEGLNFEELEPEEFREAPKTLCCVGYSLLAGKLIPTTLFHWPLRWSYGDLLEEGNKHGDEMANLQGLALKAAYVAAFFSFLSQPFVTKRAERGDLPRATRRRLPASLREQVVRVIQLRRAHSVSKESPVDIEWSCRWMVGAHWRNQWYPRLGRHQSIPILPYVKGPPDKPLKPPRARVFAVVR